MWEYLAQEHNPLNPYSPEENTTMQLTVALFNHYMKFWITLSSPYVYRYIVNKHGKVEHGHSCLLYFGAKLHRKKLQ